MTTIDDTTTTGSGPAVVGDVFEVAFGRIAAELDGLAGVPAWRLSEEACQARLGESLQLRARVEELTGRLVASVAEREVPRRSGAASTRGWLMATHGVSRADAARLVKETGVHPDSVTGDGSDGSVARLVPVRAAWALGRVSAEQAVLIGQTISRLSGDVTAGAVARLVEDLVGHAQTLTFDGLRTVCRHAGEVVDPDGADARLADQLERDEKRALAGAELTFRRSGDGWTGFSGRIPDTHADLWKKALDAYTNPRHPADTDNGTDHVTDHGTDHGADQPVLPLDTTGWVFAGPGCPHRPPNPEPDPNADPNAEMLTGDPARGLDGADPKTMAYPQRLGRAWCDLLEHLPVDGLPRHGANSTTLMVTLSLDQLQSGLGEAVCDTGTPMSPGQVRRLACNAAIIPVVLGADSTILDLGLTRRLFDRYQRLALAVRDGGCIWPACDKPPAWTEAHHITYWTNGGPTDIANGCLLCPYHHHLIHRNDGWQIQMAPDGVPEIIPPTRLDPEQQPRRHERLTRQRC